MGTRTSPTLLHAWFPSQSTGAARTGQATRATGLFFLLRSTNLAAAADTPRAAAASAAWPSSPSRQHQPSQNLNVAGQAS